MFCNFQTGRLGDRVDCSVTFRQDVSVIPVVGRRVECSVTFRQDVSLIGQKVL